MKIKILVLAFFLGPLFSFAQSNTTVKINALLKEMTQDFNANNMLKVSTIYLDSATIIGGGSNLTGRTAIDNYWLSLKDKSATWRLENDKVEDHGDIVIQRGRSYLSFSTPKSSGQAGGQSNVRFILIWKKTGDTYRILYDTFFRL